MSTEATVQVLDSSVDVAGVSVATATRTVANPRNGAVYEPNRLAAGVPVWVHRLQDGRYMVLYRTKWTAATSSSTLTGTQLYSAHTEDVVPTYILINPTTGASEGPFVLPGMDTLDAAYSRKNYLFVTGTKDGVGWIQHYFLTELGGVQLQGEEPSPLGGFHLGLYTDGFYLHVFGEYGDGKLARIRKNWARIGINTDDSNQWEYEGPKGWYPTVEDGGAMVGDLPAAGPCSMAKFKDRFFIIATDHQVGAYFSKIYSQRVVDQVWKPTGGLPLALGADGAYMGGTAYIQDQLPARREAMLDGTAAGFPYVTSVRTTVGSDQAILTEWGMLTM